MKPTLPHIFLILILACGAAAGQGYGQGVECFECPVCHTVFPITSQQKMLISPYDLCPVCFSGYAFSFAQVPCENPNVPNDSTGKFNLSNGSDSGNVVTNRSASQPRGSILMVISQKDYQEIELNEPSRIFRESGFTVVVASKEAGAATSMGNEKATADIAVRNALLSDYVAVVFVGGMGVYDGKLAFDPEFKSLAEMAGKRDMVVGAICLAPMILANAGVITGRNATVSPMQEAVELLMQSGANYTEKGVVVDGKVITASGPDESEEFAMAVVDAIGALGTYPAAEKGTVVEKGGTLALQGVNNPPSGAAPGGPVSASSPATMSKYRCTTCSYVYDPQVGDVTGGIAAGTPFENLPASWRCPICGASKDLFVKA